MSILKNKFIKILLIILLTIVIIAFSILIYVNYNLNSIINNKIYEKFNNSTISEYYDLSFNKLRINILTKNLKLFDVKFTHKTDTNKIFFNKYGSADFKIDKLILRGVDIFTFIKTDSINANKIIIKKPEINIIKGNNNFKPFNFIEKTNDTLNILVSLKTINILNAVVSYKDNDNSVIIKDLNVLLKNIIVTSEINIESFNLDINKIEQFSKSYKNINNVTFKNLNVNISKLNIKVTNDSNTYKYNNFKIKINKPKFNTKDSLYTFKSHNIAIDYKNKDIKIDNLLFTPNFSKKEFAKKFKYQVERYSVDIKSLVINDIDITKFILKPHINANNIEINSLIADIYRDKTYPLNRNNFPIYPAQQIQKIGIPISINNISIKNSNITYIEKISSKKTGKVDVSNLNIDINDITNDSTKKTLKVLVKGKVRNKIPFRINVNFYYNKPLFTFNGTVFKSNLKNANKILSSFEPIELKNGTVNKLTFKGFANNTSSNGEMLFLYKNINVNILNNDNKTTTKIKNKLTSILANTIIYRNNPALGRTFPRTVKFSYIRDKNKGFINFIWKSLFNGIVESIKPTKANQKKYKVELKKQKKK